MIFKPELVRAIVAGKKTQTRRPVKPDQACRYKLEHSYAIQSGRGKPATARILITAVSEKPEAVGDITLKDAMREGFKTTAAFKLYWVRLHDAAWAAPKVPCPLCAGGGCHDCNEGRVVKPREDEELLARFEARHAFKLVWVITFELHADPPRFLLPASRPHGSERGYTANAHDALEDAEGVDDATLVRFAEAAREREKLRASQDDPDLSARVARLLDAQAQGHDVSRQLAAIERAAQRGERRLPDAA